MHGNYFFQTNVCALYPWSCDLNYIIHVPQTFLLTVGHHRTLIKLIPFASSSSSSPFYRILYPSCIITMCNHGTKTDLDKGENNIILDVTVSSVIILCVLLSNNNKIQKKTGRLHHRHTYRHEFVINQNCSWKSWGECMLYIIGNIMCV